MGKRFKDKSLESEFVHVGFCDNFSTLFTFLYLSVLCKNCSNIVWLKLLYVTSLALCKCMVCWLPSWLSSYSSRFLSAPSKEQDTSTQLQSRCRDWVTRKHLMALVFHGKLTLWQPWARLLPRTSQGSQILHFQCAVYTDWASTYHSGQIQSKARSPKILPIFYQVQCYKVFF